MVDSNVKVAVRVRPMNQRELDLKAECVVYMEGKQTVLKSTSPTYEGSCAAQKEFLFDHCFWSVNDEGPAKYTSQEDIFETLGKDLLDSIFDGFNSCIFVYGQTGSGKTFSMMGSDDQPGLVPRICSALFSRDISHLKSLQVEAAYLEIYNEKVRDLLHPTSDFKALKVREHKSFGPYVEGLSHHVVRNQRDIKSLIDEGNKCRKIASTKMNEQSSRSHAIFTLAVTQTLQNERGAMKELMSKVSLVDLAGSERTSTSGATGDRMKESNNINKSLTSLGLVINSLAELSQGKRRSSHVNYRDSMLTWLLKNNLGGNSKTVMLATISPASVHYQETLSTLNYANSAKRIVNKATVNEDIKSKAIDELKDEVRSLRKQLQQSEEKYKKKLEAKLNESEKLLQELKFSWEEKLKKTETSALERQKHLQRLGITVEDIGIRVDEEKCYLINSSSGISHQKELILYHLGEITKIGAGDSQDIQITRPGIELEHCVIDIKEDGEVYLTPNKNAEIFVNGSRVQTVVMLNHEDKIKIGKEASFTLHKPNTKPNPTHERANAVDSAPSNQDEERYRQGNESIDEECDSSVSSDNIQWSYREDLDGSVSKCPYSNDSYSIDSSGHGFLDISQNKSIVSPEISDNKPLEDQDSCDRKITPIDTIISPKNHKEDSNSDHFKSYNKRSIKDDSTDIKIQISEDDKTDINLTVRVENVTGKNKISTEDEDRTDPSINQSAQSETKPNISSDNEISKGGDGKTKNFINSTSQTVMEKYISGENQISNEGDGKTNNSINPTSQTKMYHSSSSENKISKEDDDKTDISINPTSQTEQNICSENQKTTEDDGRTDPSISQSAQSKMEHNVRSENKISKEDDDKTDISINPTFQTVQNICSENQKTTENNGRTHPSISQSAQSKIENNVRSENKISKEGDDDKSDISINPTSQTDMEDHLSVEDQISTEEDVRTNPFIDQSAQSKMEHIVSNETETYKEGDESDDITEISTNPTSQPEMEENLNGENQISKEDDDRTNISINPTSQTFMEQILRSQSQISKDDKTNVSINATSQTGAEENINDKNQISKEGDDRTNVSINHTSQTEMEQTLWIQSKVFKNDKSNFSVKPTSPSAELSIEDNQEITRSENNLKNYKTSEGHTRVSTGSASSEDAACYIRRSRSEIMAVLQKDLNDWMDDLDSQNIITQEEYFTVEKMSNIKDKVRALVNIILQKDELARRAFIRCLKLNLEEENLPEQEAKKSHLVESKKVNTDKDEKICEPDENLQEEIETKDRRTCFQDLLEKIEFQRYQTSKLTLREVLDIGAECLMPGGSPMENEAWYFIRKLMSLLVEARDISTIGNRREMSREDGFMLDVDSDLSGGIHPLDLQCAILHCSDHFLQQEMISKMSMCQFSVPLLLPASDGPDWTLMLWAMRGIVKKWRPQSLAESKGFLEEHLVKISMPTFSFVRLGNCRLSKSKILNQILSSTQNCQDIFIHRDMEGGNVERRISSGLVEISWYFPAGKGIFAEPVAFTNLRGELENNLKPFSFLAEMSSIVVVFAETLSKTECDLLLTYKNSKTKYLFIIAPEKQKSKKEIEEMRESVMSVMEIKKDNVLVITRSTNEAKTVMIIHSALMKLEKENTYCLSVEDMSRIATQQEISVDEHVAECQAAESEAKAITEEIRDVVEYKGRTMKLQAQLLKDLSRLEKELCQMKKQENKNGEKYKSELRRQCDEIRRRQWECEMPRGVSNFIKAIETKNRSEKIYFLGWLKYYLDLAARKTLTSLHEEYKRKSSQARDSKELTEIDKKISDSSLGIEHFLREVSQFYEVWHFMGKKKTKYPECSPLPERAADLLLDGYPLELIDGDSSRIHVQWVSDVLEEVNSKTGGRNRIRVITVLGVQSTGKSTLLNTMFGLQFPVASGRCTRGAFMTLIKVKENLQKELSCEYLLVIDTEGLKAPELDSLEGSYEHDNELATLVVGLSDITVINLAMENITEMKDILQIVIHAFLRMKEIGKKPNCQFVHQNVSDVSAHDKNMRDRNKLLEQLNEMTKTVAEMEKKPQYKVFSDVMEYDAEQNHWYIPSLWQGVPPMAPVSAAYSEHVAELKQNLLKLIEQKQDQAQTIPQFVRWMGDLWNAVKHENFIFSFRNSLVANAYNKLSMKYSELEWKFKKQIHEWFTNTETIIKNQSEDTLEAKGKECCIKLENIISIEQNKILTWVEEYFQQEKDCVYLKRYKEDFIVSAKMLGENLRRSSYDKYNNATHIQKQQHKIKGVRKQYIEKIERKVSSLMEECRKRRHQMEATKMEEEFEIMWKETVKEFEVKPQETRDVEKDMMLELTKTMRDKGSAVNETFNQIKNFPKPENKHKGGLKAGIITVIKIPNRWWNNSKHKAIFQSVLEKCCKYSAEQARRDADYDDTYCRHLLNMIDEILKEEENIPAERELEIKLVILGHAVTVFQEMHNNFIKKNDPRSQLETLKSEYFSTFMNVFREKNESQDLAKRICGTCLKPAMIDYIHRNLGIELVDDIMRSEGSYTSRTFFQYTVLVNLLEGNDFRKYVEYSINYERFVKNWIFENIIVKYKNYNIIQSTILSGITKKIRDLLDNPEMWNPTKNVEDFLDHFQKKLNSDLVFPQEKMKAIIFRNSANTKEFIQNLNNFLTDTKEEITEEMESLCVQDILSKVTVKPQDELFKKVFGCGKQCPFCAVPCEAGGENHEEHFASIHRPKGLGAYAIEKSSILSPDICTTSVCGDKRFKNTDTNQTFHPYKKYREIYPDWRIQPDPSIETSDYWKFVLKEFNERFAEEYEAKPADYPKEWDSLTKDMAKESLRKTFNM